MNEEFAGMSVSLYCGQDLPRRQPVEVDTSAAFRILVLADLGSNQPWGHPQSVDCDDLDDIIKKLGVNIQFAISDDGPVAEVDFTDMDDFHPDQLFRKMEVFSALRERRKRLENPATFAAELLAMRGPQAETSNDDTPKADNESATADASSLLDQAVNLAQAQQVPLEQQIVSGTVDWDDYVRQLASPYLVDKADPRQAEMLEYIDAMIAEVMRQVLHHPRFQQIEATWSGIHFLTRRLETNRTLQIEVLNVSQQALQADLRANDDLSKSQLYKLLAEYPEQEQESPWSLIVGDYQFDSGVEDCQTVRRVAKVCEAAGVPFVAGAASTVAGCESFAATPDPDDWEFQEVDSLAAWSELRQIRGANHVALALPRILGRRVYGRETDPIESFGFEELPDGNQHAGYLWMNAAYGVATLCGQSFSENDWDFKSRIAEEISRLPIHYFVDEGEETLKACAEAYLVDRAAEKLSQLGLTVTRSVRNDGAIRFEFLKSLSKENSAWPPV